ncbi:FecR family protein [Flavobacterium sp. SM2513]|uniref:FecR family protein n=1 Tax=Flavobacterium sp. SM2513 TaxID=3424766 RepID=UPI003D7F2BE9
MKENDFKEILKKHEEGTASHEEIKLVENFFELMEHNGEGEIEYKKDLALKNRMYKAIEKKRKPKSTWSYNRAASILLMVSIGLASLIALNLVNFNATKNISQMTKKTRGDEQTKIYLPDGSLVILNGNSTVEYPQEFTDSVRFVKLKGQAFFEVTKNPEKPFIIQTGNIATKVLGTSFSITQIESTVEVIVNTGLVNVSSLTESVNLEPNQKVTYSDKAKTLRKHTGNAEITKLWWKDEVVLEKIQWKELATTLQEIYKIPFVFKDEDSKKGYLYSFKLRKDEPLDSLITRVNFINETKLIKQKNSVKIEKKYR